MFSRLRALKIHDFWAPFLLPFLITFLDPKWLHFYEPFGVPFPAREVSFGDPVRGTLPEAPTSHFGMLLAAPAALFRRSWVLFGCSLVALWMLLAALGSLLGLPDGLL